MKKEEIFPWDYSKKDLKRRIYQDRDALGRDAHNLFTRQEKQIDIQLGLSELQSRNGFWLAIAAIGISVLAVSITVYFEFQDNKSNQSWQEQELELLRQIEEGLN